MGSISALPLIAIIAAVLIFVSMKGEKQLDPEHFTRVDFLADSLKTEYYKTSVASKRAVPSIKTSQPRKPEVYIELNSADSSALVGVRGIGAVISRNIIQYRERLGGFASLSQLREVYGITDENFTSIAKQFFIDNAVIQKIDINFADPDRLRSHPYVGESITRRIMAGREKRGDWSSLRELTDNDILLPGEAERLAPYLIFGTSQQSKQQK